MLILRPHDEPVATGIDGSWFLWVVGTQSVSIVVSALPLGMYATASMRIGRTLDIDLIDRIGRVATRVALVAWTAALVIMVTAAARHIRRAAVNRLAAPAT